MNHINALQNSVNQTALDQGACLVGYTKIRRTEPVIVIAYPFSTKWVLNHPFYITKRFGEEILTGHQLHQDICTILKKEGYTASVKSSLSVFGDFRPLAIAAGLGQWGKNGLVVNNAYGSKLLFSAIFTNAPFNTISNSNGFTKETKEHSICKDCEACMRACPGNAFEEGRFHFKRCFPKSIRGCSECIQVCTVS